MELEASRLRPRVSPISSPHAFTSRTGSRALFRVAAIALLLWTPAAALVLGILRRIESAEVAAVRNAAEARQARRLEDAGHLLLTRLAATRSDLHLLGASPAVDRYVADSGPAQRAALVRELQGFAADRPWCRSVWAVPANAAPVLGERQPGGTLCRVEIGHASWRLPVGESLLARTPAGSPDLGVPRLCIGLPVSTASEGHHTALVAEIDPRSLLADLEGAPLGVVGPLIVDGGGQTVLGRSRQLASAEVVTLAVGLPHWHGPAAGTWRVSLVAPATDGTRPARLRRSALLGIVLLLVLAIGAHAGAREIHGRRTQGRLRRRMELLQPARDDVQGSRVRDRRRGDRPCAPFEPLAGPTRVDIPGETVSVFVPRGMADVHHPVDSEPHEPGRGRHYYEARGPHGRAVACATKLEETGLQGVDSPTALAGRAALVVHPSSGVRESLAVQLRGLEISVREAADPATALSLLKQQEWEVALVDEEMGAVDGPLLAVLLRRDARYAHLPVVLLGRPGRVPNEGALGRLPRLVEPVRPATIRELLAQLWETNVTEPRRDDRRPSEGVPARRPRELAQGQECGASRFIGVATLELITGGRKKRPFDGERA